MQRSFASIVASTVLLAATLPNSTGAAAAGAFHRALSLQGYSFHVQASGEGSRQQLTVSTRGGKLPIPPISQVVEGRVVDAEVADLNSDTLPELYVYVQSAGSGSYGQLVAYSVVKGQPLSPIYLQELTGPAAKGYQGHDDFRVVEGCLVRRFPIYKTGDSNAKATGGLRQICYKLRHGEASWILRPTSVLQF